MTILEATTPPVGVHVMLLDVVTEMPLVFMTVNGLPTVFELLVLKKLVAVDEVVVLEELEGNDEAVVQEDMEAIPVLESTNELANTEGLEVVV